MINSEIVSYNNRLNASDKLICHKLSELISEELIDSDNKIWHSHPVWFLDGNPIVGYSKEKRGIRLMFWSGADFDEDNLNVKGGKFRDASVFYTDPIEINENEVKRWLAKSQNIQWDYKNIVKRKGQLVRLK